MKKIYSELSRIQRELKAPKNLYNKFGNYYYRNAEGILEAVKPLLKDNVLLIDDEVVVIGDRFYIKATATLTDGEESVSTTAYAREDEAKKGMDACQITGACSSYARKYALNALLMIDDSKDSDDNSLSPLNPDKGKTERQEPKAVIATVETVPEIPAEKPKEPTEAQVYLLKAVSDLRKARNMTPAQHNKLFKEQREYLMAEGFVPNKALEEYTLEEAVKLIEYVYKMYPVEVPQ